MSPSSLLLISHQGVRSSCGVWERKRLQPCAPELDEASEKTEVKEIKGSVERQLIVKCIKGLENMSKERKKSGEVKIKWAARMEKSTQGWRQRLVLHTEYLCFPIAVLVSLSWYSHCVGALPRQSSLSALHHFEEHFPMNDNSSTLSVTTLQLICSEPGLRTNQMFFLFIWMYSIIYIFYFALNVSIFFNGSLALII